MGMEFKKCRTCGRIFQTSYGNECPSCVDEREREFVKVRDYLYDNPQASVAQVVDETGVDSKRILRFLREGRMEMTNADGFLICEKCGKPITSGAMCAECKERLAKAMDSVLPSAQQTQQKPERKPKTGLGSAADKLHVNVHNR